VQVSLKSVSNEGHFILQAHVVFRPYLASHIIMVTEALHMALPARATSSASFIEIGQ
jgi:hypothetical protein